MNREVMGRQMFAKGGAAFPDLSGDGNVTQKDILMGRGVIPMQDGGMAPMPMPAAPGPQMTPPGMPPIDPNSVDINQAAQGAMQQGIDPAELEGMLTQYAGQMEDLDNAEDYETVINGIRGDSLPIEQRYQELATVVGPEDSQATPESVLTLLQPVMQIAMVDQGIGGLAAEEMSGPVEGAMAEGIMSTVNMGAPEAPVQVPGGPAPVNFNQGGPVVYMQAGGDPRLGELYADKQAIYGDILGMADQEAELADRQNMTEAQMLFDVAQGALMFATPGDKQMSGAERLAQSFQPVLGNISARAGDLQKFKEGQKAEKRALNLQALGSAEASLTAEIATQNEKDLLASKQRWETSENVLQRAHEINKQTNLFDFNAGESSLGRGHQTDLAQLKIDAQMTLQALEQDFTTDHTEQKAQIAANLAKVNYGFANNLQNNLFDFKTSERLGSQEYSDAVMAKKFANDKSLVALQFDNSKEMIGLKDMLLKENEQLERDFLISQATVEFDRTLDKMGVANTYDLGKLEFGAELNEGLARVNSELAIERQTHEQAFQSAERIMQRAFDAGQTLTKQDFQREMQEDMQSFNADQSTIDRGIAKVNRAFDEQLALRGADQGDRKLDLTEQGMALDNAYNLGKLAIDRMEAKNKRLGSESKTATISYLTDPERLSSYANGDLGAGTAEFEQLVLDYIKPERVWNGEVYVEGAGGQLAGQILESIKTGNPAFYQQITKGELEATSGGSGEGGAPTNLNEATVGLFNSDGTVNRASEGWTLTEPNRFDPNVDYRKVIGASRVFPGIGKMLSEGSAELFGGDASPEAQNLAKASTSLEALANDLLQFSTNQSDGRVLKFVQEKIEKEVANIRPGGLFLKTDADASAAFQTLSDMIAQQMQIGASILPEYGGKTGNYTEKQVTATRADMDQMKVFMNELLAFQEGFEFVPISRTSGIDGQDQSLGTARDQINSMRRNRNGG